GRLLVVHPDALDTAIAVFDRGRDSSGQGFQLALDELTRGGLSATPAFALLEWLGSAGERALRVIVRGGVKVAVTATGSEATLDGTGVSTWTEQTFQQVSAFEVVVVPEPDSTFDAGHTLPLDSGVVAVTRVSSGVSQPLSPQPQAKAAQPEPAPAQSEPEPEQTLSEVSEVT